VVEGFPEARDKEFVSVGDDIDRQAIVTVPVFEEEESKRFGRDVSAGRYKADVSARPIGDGDDAIEMVIFGKRANEINGDAVTTGVRHRMRVKRANGFLGG
jgi:phosphopantothenate synthetase